MTRPRRGPRSYRLSNCERILRAIKLARRRFTDDYNFVAEVNAILVRERILKKEDFGTYGKGVDEEDEEV